MPEIELSDTKCRASAAWHQDSGASSYSDGYSTSSAAYSHIREQSGVYAMLDAGWRYLAAVPDDPEIAELVLEALLEVGLGGVARELLQARREFNPQRVEEWRRRLQDTGPILAMTSRATTMLQYSTRDIGHAFEELGYEFHLLIESADHCQLTGLRIARMMLEIDPILFVQIDHLRYEHKDLLFDISGGFLHQRTYEALASGALPLVRYSPGDFMKMSPEEFDGGPDTGEFVDCTAGVFPGLSRVVFRSAQEFESLAERYLADDGERQAVLSNYREVVFQNYTYSSAMGRIMGEIKRRVAEPAVACLA